MKTRALTSVLLKFRITFGTRGQFGLQRAIFDAKNEAAARRLANLWLIDTGYKMAGYRIQLVEVL